MLKKKYKEALLDIEKTREDLKQARMDGVMPKYGKHAPKFNKDTKVNLDMSMWITHNITKEEYQEPKYEEPSKYEKYEEPKTQAPIYEPPKYEPPKYEPPKYER